MSNEKEQFDFKKLIEGIEKKQMAELKEAFKTLRMVYLELRKAGFNMMEAMVYLAALTRLGEPEDKK